MEKLTPKDIKIKARGSQIRDYIEEKYGSLEEFSKNIINTTGTVKRYLRDSEIGNSQFINRLEITLNKNLDEIAPDKKRQIINFVNSILHNYTKYRDKEDLETIEKVMELCKEENMKVEEITMERNRAMYYFNDERRKQAIDMLEEIIEKAYEKRFYYHWIYFSCDLAVLHSFMADHKKAEKIYDRLHIEGKGFVEDYEFKDKALYKYHYSYGVLCNRIGKYNKAKWLFEDSLNYITRDTDEAMSILGIGLSYKKKDKYDEALEYYFQALEVQPSVEWKILILNNITEVYKQKEDYNTATKYINKAMEYIELYDMESSYYVYVTYLEIKFLKGDTEGTIEELMDWTIENNTKRVTKVYIISGLNAMIDLAIKKKTYNYLLKLEDLIIEAICTSEEEAFIGELKKCIGSIHVFLYKENYKGRILNEKESI